MFTCEQCRDRLLDHVYDLLDADDAEEMHDHLAGCHACQIELQYARQDKARIAEAACIEVPSPRLVFPPKEVATLPARRPFPPTLAPRRWPMVASIAAAIALVALPLGYHAQQHARHRSAVAALQNQLIELHGLREQGLQAQLHVVSDARSRELRLQVVGPASYDSRFASVYQVLTNDLLGRTRAARVSVTLQGAAGQSLYSTPAIDCQGLATVELPAGLPADKEGTLTLVVSADADGVREELSGQVAVRLPQYQTHLQVDKSHYQPGERVFYRSLTLDRFTLKPPGQPLQLAYTAYDSKQRLVHKLIGKAHESGVGSGEFVLPRDAEGEITLIVAETANRFPSQLQTILVSSQPAGRLKKSLKLQRGQVAPGEPIVAEFQALREDGKPVKDSPVRATLRIDGKTLSTAEAKSNDAGTAHLKIDTAADSPLGQARLEVEIDDVGRREKVVRTVDFATSAVAVDLLPEGGVLVGDVENAIYVRARDAMGQPAHVRGRVLNGDGKTIAEFQTDKAHGLGRFPIVPQSQEKYRVEIQAPAANHPAVEFPSLFAPLGLKVDDAVHGANTPIRVTVLAQPSEERDLVLSATCRGQVVAHEHLSVSKSKTEVTLRPTRPVHGVLRVTLHDARGPKLIPVAERLIYRVPSERLTLQASTAAATYKPGSRVQVELKARNERDQAEPAWFWVSVVEAEARRRVRDPQERSLPAYFHVLGEAREPIALEWSDVMLEDHPQAREQLDRFLGTQGWRRLKTSAPNPGLAKIIPTKTSVEPPAIMKWDSLVESEQRALAAAAPLLSGSKALEEQWAEEWNRLTAARDESAAAAAAYGTAVYDLMKRLYPILGVALLLLAAGFVAVGVARSSGGLVVPSPAFAGATAALVLGALSFVEWNMDWLGQNRLLDPTRGLAGPPNGALASAVVGNPGANWTERDSLPATQVVALVAPRLLPDAVGPRLRSGATGPMVLPALPPSGDGSLVVREYAYLLPKIGNPEAPETLYWHPLLIAADGTAKAQFDLPRDAREYLFRVHGHSASGRLGAATAPIATK